MSILPTGPVRATFAELPPQLLEPCRLAAREYQHFGIIFFQPRRGLFHYKDPAIGRTPMIGFPSDITDVSKAVDRLPPNSVEPDDTFYARDPSGRYSCISSEGSDVRIEKFPADGMAELEASHRIEMIRALMPILAENGHLESMGSLVEKAPDLVAGTVNLRDCRFEELFQYPRHLRRLAPAIQAMQEVPEPAMIKAMGDWPPNEIQGFFKAPQSYGHDLPQDQLEHLAMQLDPKHASAIVRAGILPPAHSPLASKYPDANQAFRREEATLLAALEDPSIVNQLLACRRSGNNSPDQKLMEAKLALHRKHSVPHLDSSAYEPSAGAMPQIAR
jgi:hypothetical protein